MHPNISAYFELLLWAVKYERVYIDIVVEYDGEPESRYITQALEVELRRVWRAISDCM